MLTSQAFGQDYPESVQHSVDSLEKEVEKSIHDTTKCNLLLDLAAYTYYYDLDAALSYCHKALQLAQKLSRDEELSVVYVWLGFLYTQNNKYSEAIEYLHEGLILSEKLNAKGQLGSIYCNIGMCHDFLGEFNLGKEYYEKALKIFTELGDLRNMAINTGNLASVYNREGNKKKARELNFQALLYLEEINDEKFMALTINNIGFIDKQQGDYESALKNFLKSAELASKNKTNKTLALAYANICDIYLKLGDIKKAEFYGSESFRLANDLAIPESIQNATIFLTDLYEKKKDYKKALEMYQLHIQMRDSITNDNNQKSVAQQQAKYEYEKQKAIDDAEHEKQLAIEQEAKEKQQILTYATAGGLGLVGIFLIFVFNRLKVTRRQKGMIEQTHVELEEKNTEILDSINYAKRIQSAILPPNKVVKEYLPDSFILYKPKDIVAGDFYWMETVNNKVLFAAADCTGHGVPGAMVSVVCNNGLNRSVREYKLTDPGKILDKTREIVTQEFEKSEEDVKDGMDIALCSLQGNTLEYAGAHNPLWIIRNNSNEIEEIKADKQPIGKTDNPQPYTTQKVELNQGDSIYIFSDGYADQFGGEQGKKMKTTNFKKLLLSIKNETMQKQKELIDEAFESWKGNLEQLDDVCVIGFKL